MSDVLFEELIKRAVEQEIAKDDAKAKPDSADRSSSKSSKAGLIALLAGGAADVGTTAYALKQGLGHEKNPLINWAGESWQLPLGVGLETAGYLLAKKLIGKDHPKLFNLLSGALGGVHGAMAVRNLKEISAAKREHANDPYAGMVRHPDGYWYDPDAFRK